jgi:ABC-type nickel/cobalt efflux system permease component RcnA
VGVAILALLALWTLDLSWLGVLVVLAVAAGLAFAVRRVHPPAPDEGLVPAP